MKEKRVSNKLKQKQLETKYLEEQTKKMEDKLTALKQQVEQQKRLRSEMGLDSTITRWQKSVKNTGTLKSYAKQVLQQQKQIQSQFGIDPKKITGAKAFEGVLKQLKKEKEDQQQRNPTKVATFLKKVETEQREMEKTVLENNFFKAKMDVKKLIKQKSLQDFLEQNFILEYLSKLNDEGINDLQSLRYVTREMLADMGVRAGHQIKIMKKIKQQFDKMLEGKYQQPKPVVSNKIESGYGQGDVNQTNPMLPIESELVLLQNNQSFNQQQAEQQQQQADTVLITLPMQQISLQTNSQEFKVNCYECYKNIFNPQLHYDQKYFCCLECMERYLSHLRRKCPCCGVTFIKTEGYHEQGTWFCSLSCCPNQQQIEDMFFQWHRQR